MSVSSLCMMATSKDKSLNKEEIHMKYIRNTYVNQSLNGDENKIKDM